MSKYTQRTLKYFRDLGYTIDVIERWIVIPGLPGKGKRKDYLGFGDLLAFDDTDTLLVQSCGSAYSEHKKKILALPGPSDWLMSRNRRLFLIAWRKLLKKKGGKLKIWVPRVAEFFVVNGELYCKEIKYD